MLFGSNEYWLHQSYAEASLSDDPSTQLGAVLLDKYRQQIGRGHNRFPEGVDEAHYHDRDAKYPRICHAEVSAILHAAKRGTSTHGSTLVCGWSACSNCAKYMAHAGVVRLIRNEGFLDQFTASWHEDIAIGDEILHGAGIKIVELAPPFFGGKPLRMGGKTWPR